MAGFQEKREYLFDKDGTLCFHLLEMAGMEPERFYFSKGTLVQVRFGRDEIRSPGKIVQEYTTRELEQAKRLRASFDRLPAVDYEYNRDRYYKNELKGK